MERIIRKPFQGLINIIRFNWHYFVLGFGFIVVLLFIAPYFPNPLNHFLSILSILVAFTLVASLFVSWYIYDFSNLYSLDWLDILHIKNGSTFVNINAGFDETSSTLVAKYPDSTLKVFDFYDPKKHTEVSIERARNAYPGFPETQRISTSDVPLKNHSADYIFLILSAHEIRNHQERIGFFKQLGEALNNNGRIIVTEHLRDIANFLVYDLGAFHFYSKKTWKQTFEKANLAIDIQLTITPFITTFILKKNGTPS